MRIHVVHSNDFDFKKELYLPLRSSELNSQHEIYLPHESDEFVKTKNLIENADVVVAEVSHAGTGLGIELGWADMLNKKIVCIYKKGSNVSSSLKAISENFIEYSDNESLIGQLSEALDNIQEQPSKRFEKTYKKGNVFQEQERSGWVYGHFMPQGISKDSRVEMKVAKFGRGFTSEPHFNKTATKIDIIWSGSAIWEVDGKDVELNAGDYLIVAPKTTVFTKKILSDELVVQTIRFPSIPDDKVLI
ncbi:MAG TPA: hypothetical protein VG965_04655 [Patescibacteria group bacterium]|nr:hypothetical protein [Patescibacteria group bacterium]